MVLRTQRVAVAKNNYGGLPYLFFHYLWVWGMVTVLLEATAAQTADP